MIITGPTAATEILPYTTTTITTSNNLTTTSNIYATTILPCPCLILLHVVSYIPAKPFNIILPVQIYCCFLLFNLDLSFTYVLDDLLSLLVNLIDIISHIS